MSNAPQKPGTAGKAASGTTQKPKTESAPKAKKAKAESNGAPRPRKWDYGIQPGSTIKRVKDGDDVKVKANLAKDWEHTKGNPTCDDYDAAGGTRHGLRVLSRRGLINIVAQNGDVFPKKLEGDAKADDKAA